MGWEEEEKSKHELSLELEVRVEVRDILTMLDDSIRKGDDGIVV